MNDNWLDKSINDELFKEIQERAETVEKSIAQGDDTCGSDSNLVPVLEPFYAHLRNQQWTGVDVFEYTLDFVGVLFYLLRTHRIDNLTSYVQDEAEKMYNDQP